jgi:hypothetical protein
MIKNFFKIALRSLKFWERIWPAFIGRLHLGGSTGVLGHAAMAQ